MIKAASDIVVGVIVEKKATDQNATFASYVRNSIGAHKQRSISAALLSV